MNGKLLISQDTEKEIAAIIVDACNHYIESSYTATTAAA